MMFVASSLAQFRQVFSEGLARMLAPDEPGAYILALANSLQSAELRAQLAAALSANFAELKRGFEAGRLDITADDREVFQQLLAINPQALETNRKMQAGDWAIQLNSMRALRPPRAASQTVTRLTRAFDADKFNFNKPFLRPEILWQGMWQGNELRVLYNKFPLAPWHMLIVPNPALGHAQFLTADYHFMAAQLVLQQQAALTGLTLGYNSLGAYASVNHLHFHGVIRERAFPVESRQWKHHGGHRAYPLSLCWFESAEASWDEIERLHAASQAYNLLYTRQGIYVMARQFQNSVEVPAIMRGAGWPELCGEVTVTSMADVEGDTADNIQRGLGLLSVKK
jgi:diadenosine tetraphosphate (Ap4A) HIT family hydrolase